ncbi:MAG TPA: hypothetical protein VLO30_07945 [Chthoniobacterales bacterium]|nr:hypothetical protein [Chthoniobacterales bacterium]
MKKQTPIEQTKHGHRGSQSHPEDTCRADVHPNTFHKWSYV